MADSTSVIQIKTALTYTGLVDAGALLQGEPAFDKENSRLFIGDGTSVPGIEISIGGDTSGFIHEIASEVGLGSTHTISCNTIGAALRCDSVGSANMSRLGFYDLGYTQTGDETSGGIQSRWHWIGSHVGAARGIWHTKDTTGVYSDMSHSPYDNTGYLYEKISYDISAVADTTSTGSNKNVPLCAYYDGTNNNSLRFKALSYSDLTGTRPSISISDISGNTWKAYYSNTLGIMTEIALGASGTVFKSNGTNQVPSFTKLGYSDLTGGLYDASALVSETLICESSVTKQFKRSNAMKLGFTSLIDSSSTTLSLIGSAYTSLKLDTTDSGSGSMVGQFIVRNASAVTDNNGKLLIGIYGTDPSIQKSIAFFTKTAIDSGNTGLGDIEFNSYGGMFFKESTTTDSTQSRYHIHIKDKTCTYATSEMKDMVGVKIDSVSVTRTQSSSNTLSNSSLKVAAIYNNRVYAIDNYGSNNGVTSGCYEAALIYNATGVTSTNNAYGIRLGSITSQANHSIGYYVNNITSTKNSYGLMINDVTSNALSNAYGSVGICVNKVRGNTTLGISILDVTNSSSDTTNRSCSLFISNSASIIDVIDSNGLPTTSHGDIDTYLYTAAGNTNTHLAICVTEGLSYFGGAVTIAGVSTFKDNISVQAGAVVTISGNSGGDSLVVENGHIRGKLRQKVLKCRNNSSSGSALLSWIGNTFPNQNPSSAVPNNNSTTFTNDLSDFGTAITYSTIDIKDYRVIWIDSADTMKFQIRDIQEGYPGQVITFMMSGYNTVYCTFQSGGNIDLQDTAGNITMYQYRPIEFIFRPASDASAARWVLIQNDEA